MSARLHDLVAASAARFPGRVAVEDPHRDAAVTYGELRELAGRFRDAHVRLGVEPGDRVAVLGKSIPALASILGALEAGAAYVPVDASAPLPRAGSILRDCSVKVISAPPELAGGLAAELGAEAGSAEELGGVALMAGPGRGGALPSPVPDLAYILYTSGSTGVPKGVMHTHRSALSFVDWCSETFEPTEDDRFSSHAPFHFDLSILDIYTPLKHGATLVLIDDELGKHPKALARVIASRRLTVWYSTPSILRLLVEFGGLSKLDCSALRTVLFAGEVFPIPHLRRLVECWPHPRYYNLYGPTETNVCTYHALPPRIGERDQPFPIGVACSGDRTAVLDEHGREVAAGEPGELFVSGGSVMAGYWNQPEKTEQCFLVRPDGSRWYATGDVVVEDGDGSYLFRGRRDRMIKRRGYRIEPGEIEAALYRHPEVVEAAVIAMPGADDTTAIKAHLSCRDGREPSLVEIKKWCADHLPRYMIPDLFAFHGSLPKTSTDKIDYQSLKGLD